MYVGKNNLQNDELTFQFAKGNDWWFHAKGAPGSHVIVKADGVELPNRTFEEAARLAAYYSSLRDSEKVEIDYVEKKTGEEAQWFQAGIRGILYQLLYDDRTGYQWNPVSQLKNSLASK